MSAPNRVFTADQVNQIVALHNQGKSLSYIEDRFGHRTTIQKILAGKAYRDLTHADGPTCACPSCVNWKRSEANLSTAREATVAVMCTVCPGVVVTRKVRAVLAKGGEVACDECRGRRK